MAGESSLYQALRTWAYKTYGMIDPIARTGLIRIFKMAMVGGMGEGGWPDMAFFVQGAHTFFIELKNPDRPKPVTPLQRQRHEELRALGFNVYVVNDLNSGKKIIKREVTHATGIESE